MIHSLRSSKLQKHIITTLLLAIFSLQSFAQLKEFEVSEMPRPDVPVVQANSQFSDDALLLIYSTIESLEIRSSLGAIDKVSFNASASRYEVLVKPVKQMLFAAKAGFIEAKIATLNPNPKDVYYFRVEEKKIEVVTDSEPGKISINSEPPGADIYLNGFKVADKTPFTFELNSGTTKIKLKKKKYEDFDTTVVIQSAKSSVLSTKLNSNFLFLNVSSEPSGAIVRIDGVELGKTPLSKEIDLSNKLQRGLKTLRIEVDGYEEIVEQISYVPSTTPIERNFELKKLKASFSIKSTPQGASVYIDGIYKGITPYTGSKDYGNYEVYVQLDEYRPSEKKQLMLSQDGIKQLDFTLRPLPNPDEEAEIASQNENEVKIGNQIWKASNLNTDRFRNGDLIPVVVSAEEWKRVCENKQPAWCYYDDDSKNGDKYGRLYNWYAVADARGLCPVGWHVPSDAEWTLLINYLGGDSAAGEKMRSTNGWKNNGNGTNQSAFSGLPAGIRGGDGVFYGVGDYGFCWSSTEDDPDFALFLILFDTDVNGYQSSGDKQSGFSVRCLRD
jgi:uncharacterized protein (TIGR02145 family)